MLVFFTEPKRWNDKVIITGCVKNRAQVPHHTPPHGSPRQRRRKEGGSAKAGARRPAATRERERQHQNGGVVEERLWSGWIGGVGISIWHRGGLRLGRIPQLPKEPVAFSRLWTVSSAVTAQALPRPWQGGCTRAKRNQQNTSKRNRATRRTSRRATHEIAERSLVGRWMYRRLGGGVEEGSAGG